MTIQNVKDFFASSVIDTNDDESAELIVHPNVTVHTVSPNVNIATPTEVTLTPLFVLRIPALFEATDAVG
jgi:hypothetical protein